MEVTPVTSRRAPSYPTRAVLDARPELLRRVPRRWRRHRAVLAAMALANAVAAGCRRDAGEPLVSRVVPVFRHGDGWVQYGGASYPGHVSLSEAEAHQVIRDEAARSDVHFQFEGRTLHNVGRPRTVPFTIPRLQMQPVELALDGSDPVRHVSYEFISTDDLEAWDPEHPANRGGGWPLAWTADAHRAAESLRKSLLSKGPHGTYVVFYDPMAERRLDDWEGPSEHPAERQAGQGEAPARADSTDWGAVWARVAAEAPKAEERARERAREELRAQVRDFIAWLKAEGVI